MAGTGGLRMSAVSCRDAGVADAASLGDLCRRTFVETFGPLYRREDLDSFLARLNDEAWRGELGDPAISVRIAEAEGTPVGYAKVGPLSLPADPGGPAAELRQLYVLKAWQGSGIAHRLMDWALARARERGAGRLFLSVWSGNERAKNFYRRYGFSFVAPYLFMVGEQADEDEIWALKLNGAP
jgi:ribosomal protein S18 acetylase RimI-like enzyme